MKRQKIREFFFQDGWLKLFSIVLAVILWFLITTIVKPEITRTISDVPISQDLTGTVPAANGLILTEMTLQTVSVQVTGTSYVINALKPSDFNVTMNLSGVSSAGTMEVDLQVEMADLSKAEYRIQTWTPKRTKVTFEVMAEKTFTLESLAPNIKADEGLMLGDLVATPATITMRGSQDAIDKIDRCVLFTEEKATLKASQTFTGELQLLDKNAQQVNSDDLIFPMQDTFRIDVPVFQRLTLPLQFDYINVPPHINTTAIPFQQSDHMMQVGIPIDPQRVPPEEFHLGEIDFRTITVGRQEQFEVSLPAGWRPVAVPDVVQIDFLNDKFKTVSLSSSNIVQKNLPSQYSVELLSRKLSNIQLVGLAKEIEAITSDDLVVTIDYSTSTIATGDRQIPVSISIKNKQQVWAVGVDYVLSVRVTEKK